MTDSQRVTWTAFAILAMFLYNTHVHSHSLWPESDIEVMEFSGHSDLHVQRPHHLCFHLLDQYFRCGQGHISKVSKLRY